MKGRSEHHIIAGVVCAALVVAGCLTADTTATETWPGKVRVAVYVDCGSFAVGPYRHLEIASGAEDFEAFPVDAEMIRRGALDGADVLVMPGGQSSVELKTLGTEGGCRIREFVRRGGGYIGTCAGAYLVEQPSKRHPNRLGLIPFDGGAPNPDDCLLTVEFTEPWTNRLGLAKRRWKVDYAGGPRFRPAAPVEGAHAEIAAKYVSEVNATDEQKRPPFIGTGAVVVGTYGKGRIFASAVHPELNAGSYEILRAAYRYVTGGRGTWRVSERRPGRLHVGVMSDRSLGVETARFILGLMREGEFELTPLNGDEIAFRDYRGLDAVLVPSVLSNAVQKAGIGRNEERTREFLRRGGRIFAWGASANAYAKLGLGVTCVEDGAEAVQGLRAFAAEPTPPDGPWTSVKKSSKPVRVAFFYDQGGRNNLGVGEALALSSEYDVRFVTGKEIGDGALANADLVFFPGGSCNGEFKSLGERGVAAVTNFVRRGGLYYGICAGAYLASQMTTNTLPRMGLVPFRNDGSRFRGRARVRVRITDEGKRVFGNPATYRSMVYSSGPVMVPGTPVPDTDIKVLAEYACRRVQTSSTTATLPMAGKAAILGGRVGKGRVFAQGPHPEADACTFDIIPSGFRYLTGRKLDPVRRHHVRGAMEVGCVVRNADDVNFFIGRLIRLGGINARKVDLNASYSQTLGDLGALVIPNPSEKDYTSGVKRLVREGRRVIAVARTDEARRMTKEWTGVRVVGLPEEALELVRQETQEGRKRIGRGCQAAECDLPRGSRALWDVKALNATPKTFPVTIPCSNEYGRVAGVEPIFVEGEPWHGRSTRVFAWWGLPKGASVTQKAPAMVLVHGGGGTAFARWVKTWNDRGYAAIAMDTCGSVPQGERDGRAHPRHEWSGPSGWADSVAQIGEPVKDQWTYHAVAAVMRCHSFLRSRPEIDAGRIGLTGISWGGYLSSIVGSVDDRFRFAAPVYGCGYYERNHEWHRMNGDREKLRAWFALWDPKNFYDSPAGGAKIPYLWCCGTNDRWYPLDTVRMSCNLLDRTVPLNLSLKYRMRHGHPPAGDPKEIAAYADSFLKGGKPLVDVTHAWLDKDVFRAEFDAHGRKAVRAELLYTCDTNAVLAKRAWKVVAVADFDAAGRLSAPVPAEAVMFFANVVTDDGLVASSRIFQREDWGLVDHPRNPSTDWMVGGCGAFVHYLMDRDMFARIGEFDVPALAKQIADMKPDWFCITLGQNTGYMCSPNATYERICGYAPGSHCSVRDIPAELIAALKPHGVKVMLYLPCQPPNRDRHAEAAFGFPAGEPNVRPTDRVINAVAAKRWGEVIEEWSRRYGKDVAGWWFDGSYRRSRFNDEIAAIYAAAVKRGNPDAVVAFNEGVKSPVRRWSMAGDYLAGEINHPLKETCPGRWSDDRQWHLLTFAGKTWGDSRCRYADEQWIDWLRPVLANGGAVTIDLAIDRPTGRLEPAQAEQLKRVFLAASAGSSRSAATRTTPGATASPSRRSRSSSTF